MNQELTLTKKLHENYAVISTSGYINNTGGEIIAEECYKLIDDGISNIILDLKNTGVVNSIGISILIEIIEKLDEVEGKLVFINLQPSIEKTFTIMGLFQFCQKAENLTSAVELLNGAN